MQQYYAGVFTPGAAQAAQANQPYNATPMIAPPSAKYARMRPERAT
jgi:hypothetical protein